MGKWENRMKSTFPIVALALCILAAFPLHAAAAVPLEAFACRDGRVSLKSNGTRLDRILETIAEAGDIRIYLVRTVNRPVWTEITDTPLDSALRSLLVGISYAVVNCSPGESAVVTFSDFGRNDNKDGGGRFRTADSPNTARVSQKEKRDHDQCEKYPKLCRCLALHGYTMEAFLNDTDSDREEAVANCMSGSQTGAQ